jgi:hypothetical protein
MRQIQPLREKCCGLSLGRLLKPKITRCLNAAQNKQKARGAWLLERHLLQREMDKAPGADQRFTIV